MINGNSVQDSCGNCLLTSDPDFNQCRDCAGVLNGNAIIDSCGVCLLPDDPSLNNSCRDCAGIINGASILDSCGICLLASDPDFNACLNNAMTVYIPNSFTPNGDLLNDYWRPRGIFGSLEVRIFNRNGQLVYNNNNIDQRGWDGLFNGLPMSPGVYAAFVIY